MKTGKTSTRMSAHSKMVVACYQVRYAASDAWVSKSFSWRKVGYAAAAKQAREWLDHEAGA